MIELEHCVKNAKLPFYWVLVYLLLSGCASQINMKSPLEPGTALAAEEGLVVLRIVNAGGSSLPFNQFTINPDNVNADSAIKPERLLAREPFHGNSTVFASAVNAGSYSVSSIRLFHTINDGWYSDFVSAEVALGTFSVQSGQVTDLGTLVYYPKFEDGKYTQTLIRVPDEEPGAVLEKFFPFYHFDKLSVLGWKEDGLEEARQESFVSAAQNPVAYEETFLAPDGTLYFLSRLGVLMTRSVTGEWALDAINTNLQMTSIDMSEQGNILLGGSEGALFFKRAGDEWQDLSIPGSEMIQDVSFLENGDAQVISSNTSTIKILRHSTLGSSASWQVINQFDSLLWKEQFEIKKQKGTTQKEIPKRRITGVQLRIYEGKHYVSVASSMLNDTKYFAATRTRTFRYNPDSWLVEAEEQPPKQSEHVHAGAAQLGIVRPGFWSWSGRTKYFRVDPATQKWDAINTALYFCGDKPVTKGTVCENNLKAKVRSFNFVSAPWFKNTNEAIAISSFSNSSGWGAKRSYETKLLKTADGGQSWLMTDHELPEKYCTDIVTEISDRLLISCNGASGDFFESLDDGATWVQVREHQNF